MSKKYKINIPKDIGIKDSQWEHLKLVDGKIVRIVRPLDMNYYEVSSWNYHYPVFKVFAEWIEEIKEEPVSADFNAGDLWEKAVDDGVWEEIDKFTCDRIKRSFILGALTGYEDNELRHKPKQTCKEWIREGNNGAGIEDTWKAALKSVGVEE